MHVFELPVEVEVHHCPPPNNETKNKKLTTKLPNSVSVPLNLASEPQSTLADLQQICLAEQGQFVVRREGVSASTAWIGSPESNVGFSNIGPQKSDKGSFSLDTICHNFFDNLNNYYINLKLGM